MGEKERERAVGRGGERERERERCGVGERGERERESWADLAGVDSKGLSCYSGRSVRLDVLRRLETRTAYFKITH